jgi:hypothetical protein
VRNISSPEILDNPIGEAPRRAAPRCAFIGPGKGARVFDIDLPLLGKKPNGNGGAHHGAEDTAEPKSSAKKTRRVPPDETKGQRWERRACGVLRNLERVHAQATRLAADPRHYEFSEQQAATFAREVLELATTTARAFERAMVANAQLTFWMK